MCKSADQRDQSRQLQNHSRHRHSTSHQLGRAWAGKAQSLRLLSYTHWPQTSALYGRGDTLKVSHHAPPAQTENTNCSASTPTSLIFPGTRDVHICLINDHLLSFTFSCSDVNKQARTDYQTQPHSASPEPARLGSPPLGLRLFLEGSSPWHRLYPAPTTVSPFPADLNKAQFMPIHLPFFLPKPSFPAVT